MALTFAFPGQLAAAQLSARVGATIGGVSVSAQIGGATGGSDVNSSGFNIEGFMASIDQMGLMKTNLHSVFFAPPPILRGFDTREVVMFCETARLPGMGFATIDGHQRYGYGQTEKIPFLPIFNDTPLGFIVDAQGIITSFFDYWMNSIVNFDVRYGLNSTGSTGASPYEVAYKRDYVTDITIFSHNEAMQQIVQYTLRDAFPIAKGDIDMDWGNQNTLAKLNMVFSYKDYFTNSFSSNVLAEAGPISGSVAISAGGITGSASINISPVANILNTINGQIVARF